MNPIILCSFCVCTTLAPKSIVGCRPCGVGSQADMIAFAQKANHAGEILTAECVQSGENFVVQWGNKEGMDFKFTKPKE